MTTSGNGFSILKLGLKKWLSTFPQKLYPAVYLRNPSTLLLPPKKALVYVSTSSYYWKIRLTFPGNLFKYEDLCKPIAKHSVIYRLIYRDLCLHPRCIGMESDTG